MPLWATGLCHGSLCSRGDHYDTPALDSTCMPMPSRPGHHYSCLENPHGQRSLVGYRSQGHKEPDTTEHSTQCACKVKVNSAPWTRSVLIPTMLKRSPPGQGPCASPQCSNEVPLDKVHAHPHNAQTKSSSTQVAKADVLTDRNGRRVEVGKPEGNLRRSGYERCPRGGPGERELLREMNAVLGQGRGAPLPLVRGHFGCD